MLLLELAHDHPLLMFPPLRVQTGPRAGKSQGWKMSNQGQDPVFIDAGNLRPGDFCFGPLWEPPVVAAPLPSLNEVAWLLGLFIGGGSNRGRKGTGRRYNVQIVTSRTEHAER